VWAALFVVFRHGVLLPRAEHDTAELLHAANLLEKEAQLLHESKRVGTPCESFFSPEHLRSGAADEDMERQSRKDVLHVEWYVGSAHVHSFSLLRTGRKESGVGVGVTYRSSPRQEKATRTHKATVGSPGDRTRPRRATRGLKACRGLAHPRSGGGRGLGGDGRWWGLVRTGAEQAL